MQTDDTARLIFAEKLRSHGMRKTAVKTAVFEVLLGASSPMSIQDIVERVKSAHFVSVYRSVESMQSAGIVAQVPQGFKNLFELSDLFNPHHHHATCKSCGSSSSIHDDRIEQLMMQLAKEAGLKHLDHHFELYGLCSKCERALEKPAG